MTVLTIFSHFPGAEREYKFSHFPDLGPGSEIEAFLQAESTTYVPAGTDDFLSDLSEASPERISGVLFRRMHFHMDQAEEYKVLAGERGSAKSMLALSSIVREKEMARACERMAWAVIARLQTMAR